MIFKSFKSFIIFIIFIIVQQVIADDLSGQIKYPKNEFNSNDSSSSVLSPLNPLLDSKKEQIKDLKKEFAIREVQNENLKLLMKETALKEAAKNSAKDNLPQRDNSKATSQKENFKSDKLKNTANANKEQSAQSTNKENTNRNHTFNSDDQHPDLIDLFIGAITGTTTTKIAESRNAYNTSSSKQSSNGTATDSGTLDYLRMKIIEQVHTKAKIFFQVFSQALSNNQLLRESLKNKNDGIFSKITSIYSSTPQLRPYQSNTRPSTNTNTWCASMSNSFAQYAQLNAFLLAAFLLFPVTIPFYLLGWVVLFLTRSIFCVGAKQILSNIIYRIRSS